MEDAVAEANDELRDELYPERERREEEIGKLQAKLDELNAEEAAALSKRSNAESRIRSLKSDISQAESDLAMLSPGEESAREALEHHISMLKSSLRSAEQDVKDANKIINSNWRGMKKSYYGSVISRLENLLSVQVKARINYLQSLTDYLRPKITKKREELAAEEPRRKEAQADVDQKRADYEKKEKQWKAQNQK